MALGMPVAIEAPTHAQRLVVRDDGHLVDLAVAAFASDSAFHVDGMIEIDVIRRLVNPLPRYWIAALPARLHCGQLGTIWLDQRMTSDARLSGRDVRAGGFLDARMAKKARHSQLPDMLGMGERNRLNRSVTDAGVFRRTVIVQAGDSQAGQQERPTVNRPSQTSACLVKTSDTIDCLRRAEPGTSRSELWPPAKGFGRATRT